MKKIDDVPGQYKVAGIAEVQDESDRDGLRIAIGAQEDANTELILNYLSKYTDLQVNLQFQHGGCEQFYASFGGVVPILTSYMPTTKEIILARSPR